MHLRLMSMFAEFLKQYGKSLTALVLGDLSGLQGDSVTVGDHHGVLVDVECEEGGL